MVDSLLENLIYFKLGLVHWSIVYRRCIGEKEKELSQLQSQTGHLATQQLPGLIQDMATLQVSTILHGDYDLKIARQDYFTSKQEKVPPPPPYLLPPPPPPPTSYLPFPSTTLIFLTCISLQVISYLLSQTARQELLSMLYEVELRRHRDTHRLLSATISHLHSLSTSRDKRTVSPCIYTHAPPSIERRRKRRRRIGGVTPYLTPYITQLLKTISYCYNTRDYLVHVKGNSSLTSMY